MFSGDVTLRLPFKYSNIYSHASNFANIRKYSDGKDSP